MVTQAFGVGLQGAEATGLPKFDPSMTNWTVPEGAVEPEAGVTAAVNVTG